MSRIRVVVRADDADPSRVAVVLVGSRVQRELVLGLGLARELYGELGAYLGGARSVEAIQKERDAGGTVQAAAEPKAVWDRELAVAALDALSMGYSTLAAVSGLPHMRIPELLASGVYAPPTPAEARAIYAALGLGGSAEPEPEPAWSAAWSAAIAQNAYYSDGHRLNVLAEETGLSEEMIRGLIHGHLSPTADEARKLSRALGLGGAS